MGKKDLDIEQLFKAQDRAIKKYQEQIDAQNKIILTQEKMIALMEAHIQELNDLISQFPR
jgi:hypothetical protein